MIYIRPFYWKYCDFWLQGVGDRIQKVVHLCCGYPSYLDQTDYLKADPMSYQMTAEKLDEAGFDQSKWSMFVWFLVTTTKLHKLTVLTIHSFSMKFSKFFYQFLTVSLEDAHRHNDLSLFDKFKKTTIILGVVTIANSRVETVDEIKERVTSVLRHIPAERLVLAPDCGLGFLPKDVLEQKLQNMVVAAKSM